MTRHPAAADRFLAGKRAAAATWRDDRWAYTEAKTDVILGILEDAGRWPAPPAGPSPSFSPG